MKQIEQLFKADLSMGFDTPKKFNRSDREISTSIVNSLEEGEFTHEMIVELSGSFPVYHYKTCITIHGKWPDCGVRSVGMYKNVHRNGNGSLEIFYSAIDRKKIKEIKTMLSSVGSKWIFLENSTDRVFRLSANITKENFSQQRQRFLEISERVKKANIYGYVNAYIQPTLWGGMVINCDIHPMSIPEGEVFNTCLIMEGLTKDQWDQKKNSHEKELEKKNAEYEEWRKENERKDQERKADMKKRYEEELIPQVRHLPEGSVMDGTIVNIVNNQFKYLRLDGPGSFGRLKFSKATAEKFTEDLGSLTWTPMKQVKQGEIKGLGWLVTKYPSQPEKPARIEANKATEAPSDDKGLVVEDYSEKACVLWGNSTHLKDRLHEIGAKPNYHLTRNGRKEFGWIFIKAKREAVKIIIS